MSAWLLLAVMVLGTAIPALACFAPDFNHSCCTAAMQDCGSMIMGLDCCAARPSQTPVLPETAVLANHALTLGQPVASMTAETIPDNAGLSFAAIVLEAPTGPSATLSILRI
jgi:hypothetical protein